MSKPLHPAHVLPFPARRPATTRPRSHRTADGTEVTIACDARGVVASLSVDIVEIAREIVRQADEEDTPHGA